MLRHHQENRHRGEEKEVQVTENLYLIFHFSQNYIIGLNSS